MGPSLSLSFEPHTHDPNSSRLHTLIIDVLVWAVCCVGLGPERAGINDLRELGDCCSLLLIYMLAANSCRALYAEQQKIPHPRPKSHLSWPWLSCDEILALQYQ